MSARVLILGLECWWERRHWSWANVDATEPETLVSSQQKVSRTVPTIPGSTRQDRSTTHHRQTGRQTATSRFTSLVCSLLHAAASVVLLNEKKDWRKFITWKPIKIQLESNVLVCTNIFIRCVYLWRHYDFLLFIRMLVLHCAIWWQNTMTKCMCIKQQIIMQISCLSHLLWN